MTTNLPIDQMIDTGRGMISREIFVSPDYHREELEKLFTRAWLFVGHESQISNPGDFFVSRMGEEAVILCRDTQGKVHVFLNSCRHRGMKVCRYESGNTSLFVCPYHSWSYTTDGQLQGVPLYRVLYEGQLDRSEWSLIEVPKLHQYKGTVWASWDPDAPDFMSYLGDAVDHLDQVLDCRDGRRGGSEVIGIHKWILPANWKFAAENFLGDTYHNPSHRSVDMIGIGPSARAGQSGRRDNEYAKGQHVWISFPQGHGVHSVWMPQDFQYQPSYMQYPVVDEYFRQCFEERKRRLGDKARIMPFTGNLFPNTSDAVGEFGGSPRGGIGWVSCLEAPMSLHPQPSIPSMPEDTARVAQAAFRRGNPYLLLRDRLGVMFEDADFADLYPRRGQAAYAPWRLALVTLLQFRETLSDRQAAEAVRARIDWKYLLGLDLTDEGFDHTLLCEFRGRLLEHEATERLLTRGLEVARGDGLLKARGRQRTDSTHVLAAVRQMNRIELLGETLRATLNTIATVAPDWLRVFAPTDWHERYDRRVEDMRLPATGLKRDAYIVQVGTDGHYLLDLLDASETPEVLRALPEVGVLHRVWARHFARGGSEKDDQEGKNKKDRKHAKAGQERKDGAGSPGTRLRSLRARGPDDRLESPYDIDARFRTKASRNWMGYMVHFTETCDTDTPHLVVHTETTPANVHEAMRTATIHDALSEKELAPAEHLADSASVSAAHIVAARERHGIDLVGPGRPDQSWQKQEEGAFQTTDFVVDWENRRARCPEGRETTGWGEYQDKTSGRVYIRAGFNVADCRSCSSKSRCTRAASRRLNLHARPEHEALAATRARHESEAGRRLYAQRQGIEGTL